MKTQTTEFHYQNPFGLVAALALLIAVGPAWGASLAEALDCRSLAWSTGGNASWIVQSTNTYDGVAAAQTGKIFDNQQTWLQTTITNGPCTISFWWRVSSESGDVLSFSVDGVVQRSIYGDSGWKLFASAIPPGTHTLTWRYAKNGYTTGGQDKGWVDMVSLSHNWPGGGVPQYTTISVCNGVVYETDRSKLNIWDASNPTNAIQLGLWKWTNDLGAVTFRGKYGYVTGTGGIKVLDVSTPGAPVLAGFCPTTGAITFGSNYAFIATGTNLVVADATNPTNLVPVGQYTGAVKQFCAQGQYGYALSDNAFTTLDMSTPAQPTRVSWYDLVSTAGGHKMVIRDNYAYIVDQDGIRILDISNPRNAVLVRFVPTYTSYPNGIALYKNYALVTCYWWGLSVLDISNPASPVEVAFYQTYPGYMEKAYGSAEGYVENIIVEGDYAYLETDYGMQVLSLAQPDNPVRVGGDQTLVDVAVQGNLAYLVDPLSGLMVVDFNNPNQPVGVGGYDPVSFGHGIAVAGDYAYLLDSYQVNILDVRNPAMPVLRGTCAYDFGQQWNQNLNYDLAVLGKYLLIAAGDAGLAVVDAGNPDHPVYAGGWSNVALGITVRSNLAYISSGSSGLNILDISNPLKPVRVGVYDTFGTANRTALSANYAFVADGAAGVQVVDVTDPTSPWRVANYPVAANDILIRNHFAYVAGSSWDTSVGANVGALTVFDIADPLNPRMVESYGTPGPALGLALAGNVACVAEGAWGLGIIPLASHEPPALVNPRFEGGALCFDTSGEEKVACVVQSTADLSSGLWTDVCTNVTPFHFTASPVGAAKFYRLKR